MDSVKENNPSPKLYIHQPKLQSPFVQMQGVFKTTTLNDETTEKVLDKEKKRFRDMTVKDKVEYFASIPVHLPRVRCEVVTERRKYVGFIHGYQNSMVMIKTASKIDEVAVPIDQINEINIVGF
ncbi:CotO family spore coat protein [Gracilibacillus marinus]|jgi:hypothetical protein|uniref:CotO family spore coat protein n=1 Tax=Gracilibacillus marinus TaxID=630535 RepID=A0ABV8VVQ5_9BACI